MPRVHQVRSARQDQGTCGKCGDPLPAGTPYVWWKFRYGGTRKRCTKPACRPKPADLTQSAFLQALYGAQEELENLDPASGVEEVSAGLASVADSIREAAEIRIEAADNMESGFGHETEPSQQLRDEGETCESAADAIESLAESVGDSDIDRDDYEDDLSYENAIVAHLQQMIDDAQSELEGCFL